MENLYDKRKVYEKSQLLENQIKENPIEMFRDWFLEAEENPAVSESNAMAVSTVEADGCPRTRMVLLKAYIGKVLFFIPIITAKKAKL
jgi:pyridoxamine 5'-phosphate oxidase